VRIVTDQTTLFDIEEYVIDREIDRVGDWEWEQDNLNLLPKLKNREQGSNSDTNSDTNSDSLLPNSENREQDKKLLPILENREQATDNLTIGSHINIKGIIYILTHRRKPKLLPNSYGWMDIKTDKSGKNHYLCLRWREGGKQRSHHLGKVTRLNDTIDPM